MSAQTLIPMLKERISIWDDIRTLAEDGEFDYYFDRPQLDPAKIPDRRSDTAAALRHLTKAIELLVPIPESDFNTETVHDTVWDYATEEGRGAVLWPIRYSLSGREKSPDPFILAAILGKKETLERLHNARDILK